MAIKKNIARLLYADSESSADMLYMGGIFIPDPFLAFELNGVKTAVLNALEYNRGIKESSFDRILPYERCAEQAKLVFKKKKVGLLEIIRLIAKDCQISSFHIPHDFPAGLAFELKKAKIKLEIIEAPFFPDREIKRDEEVAALRKGSAASVAGIRAAENVLRKASIKQGKIHFEGKVLTSERLRYFVECACLEAGAMPSHTIIAGGDQACDPHCIGSGPLKANELIIIDVFPRVTATGYHGDMTRTFLKGHASDAQKRLHAAVLGAQRLGMSKVKNGVLAGELHKSVVDYFTDKGYETKLKDGVNVGFFHSTGHGLGLDVHEAPRLGPTGPSLKTGMVVTVEPGLYYPGLGACRIEDVVLVKKDGYDKLSKYNYRWLIQ